MDHQRKRHTKHSISQTGRDPRVKVEVKDECLNMIQEGLSPLPTHEYSGLTAQEAIELDSLNYTADTSGTDVLTHFDRYRRRELQMRQDNNLAYQLDRRDMFRDGGK